LDTKRYSGITISWKYNETHSNTVTSYIKTWWGVITNDTTYW
jgi:hypothetical protein